MIEITFSGTMRYSKGSGLNGAGVITATVDELVLLQ